MSEEKPSFFKSSFFIRTCSGVVLVILALALIITGGNVLLAGLGLISLIGVFELDRVMKIHNTPMGYLTYLLTVIYYIHLFGDYENRDMLVMIFILSLILCLAVYVLQFPKYKSEQALAAYFGLFYVSVMLSYIWQTRITPGGAYTVWLAFLCSWGCDTCAYLAGITMGKHKMAPILSPKKSIEGAVGGVIGAVLLGVLYGYVFRAKMPFDNPMMVCGIVCFIGSFISMIGDLAASAIKRDHEIKDYGTLIPGHGGILDRFDSVIFTAPVIFYTVSFFLK